MTFFGRHPKNETRSSSVSSLRLDTFINTVRTKLRTVNDLLSRSSTNDGCVTPELAVKLFEAAVVEARKAVFVKNGSTTENWDELPEDSDKKQLVRRKCSNHQRVLLAKDFTTFEAKLDAAFLRAHLVEGVDVVARANELGLKPFFRSLAKGFGAPNQVGCYAKGDRETFVAFASEAHGDEFFADWGRAGFGSRHDWILTFAFGCYYNIPMLEEFFESSFLSLHGEHPQRFLLRPLGIDLLTEQDLRRRHAL
jgi:hypothetical protein